MNSPYVSGEAGYRRMLVALPAAGIATFVQLYAIQGILPRIATDLGVLPSESGLTVSAATLGLAMALLPWSFLADRWGRIPAMSASLALAALVGVAGCLAPSFSVLLGLRLLEGAALGGIPALAITVINERIGREHRAFAVGIYIAGTTLGGLLGRVLIGPLSTGLEWRWAMLSVTLVAVAFSVLFLLVVPRRPWSPEARPPYTQVAGIILRPGMIALYLQGFLLMGGFVAVYNYLAFRLESPPFRVDPGLASLAYLAYLAGTASATAVSAGTRRAGPRAMLVLSIGAMAGGLLLTLSGALAVVLAGTVLLTAGFFGAHSVASGWTASSAPVGTAQASSLYNISYYVGSSLMGWLGGIAFERGGWGELVAFVGVMLVSAAALALLRGALLDPA